MRERRLAALSYGTRSPVPAELRQYWHSLWKSTAQNSTDCPLGVTGGCEDAVPATDSLPSVAEGQYLARNHWQLDPNFRSKPSSNRNGSTVPTPDWTSSPSMVDPRR